MNTAVRTNHVLYVEDETMLWRITKHKLAPRYELLCARNDREAIEVIERMGRKLEAVIMDIDLKGSMLDGVGLTRLIRGTLPAEETPDYARSIEPMRTPVLFVTAYSERYTAEEVERLGAQGLLTKPIDFAELSLCLTRAHLGRFNR